MRHHPALWGAFGRMAQEPIFEHSCLQPLIDHPSDDTIRDSLVKKGTQVGVCSGWITVKRSECRLGKVAEAAISEQRLRRLVVEDESIRQSALRAGSPEIR